MKIIILGAGQMGASVAQSLVSENNDITVIDTNNARLTHLQNHFDLRTVTGNAALPSVLKDAGADDADLLIAVTSSDQVNLVACKLAKKMFNLPSRIARLRTADYLDNPELLSDENFAVDFALCPENIVTEHIVRLIDFPGALQVLDFAGGKVVMVAMQAHAGGKLLNHPLHDISKHLPPEIDMRVVAIFRKNKPLQPHGDTILEEGDEVFVLAAKEHIRAAMLEIQRVVKPVKNIMMIGGGNIGFAVARALQNTHSVRLIEKDRARCEHISKRLINTLVLHGDGSDENFLPTESISEMDIFIALTNDDETNIMSSLLAKHMECPRVIALINRSVYAELVQEGRIDIAISPAQTSMGTLLTRVRRGDISKVHSLRRGAAEALEIVVHGDKKTSKVVGRTIGELQEIEGAYIGAVIRGVRSELSLSEHGALHAIEHETAHETASDVLLGNTELAHPLESTVLMGHKSVIIEEGDHVIVFCQNKKVIKKVEQLFAVAFGFF